VRSRAFSTVAQESAAYFRNIINALECMSRCAAPAAEISTLTARSTACKNERRRMRCLRREFACAPAMGDLQPQRPAHLPHHTQILAGMLVRSLMDQSRNRPRPQRLGGDLRGCTMYRKSGSGVGAEYNGSHRLFFRTDDRVGIWKLPTADTTLRAAISMTAVLRR
jgi:hypothetical protein